MPDESIPSQPAPAKTNICDVQNKQRDIEIKVIVVCLYRRQTQQLEGKRAKKGVLALTAMYQMTYQYLDADFQKARFRHKR